MDLISGSSVKNNNSWASLVNDEYDWIHLNEYIHALYGSLELR